MTPTIPNVEIYSDGGANPNPGPGGYGVIMCYKGIKKEFFQGFTKTTNNRMELLGAITGLKNLKTHSKVVLTTDSQYTINGIQKGWAKKWKANNWFRTGNKKAVNHDLWEILLELTEKHDVRFQWVKGHNDHPENERCDELATQAQTMPNLLKDEGFVEKEVPKIAPTLPLGDNSTTINSEFETVGIPCKKCLHELVKKIPKHNKKTLTKKYYYAYYHHCLQCKTNYMLEEAKRDVKDLVL